MPAAMLLSALINKYRSIALFCEGQGGLGWLASRGLGQRAPRTVS